MERVEFDKIMKALDALYIHKWDKRSKERKLQGYNVGVDMAIATLKEFEPESEDGGRRKNQSAFSASGERAPESS